MERSDTEQPGMVPVSTKYQLPISHTASQRIRYKVYQDRLNYVKTKLEGIDIGQKLLVPVSPPELLSEVVWAQGRFRSFLITVSSVEACLTKQIEDCFARKRAAARLKGRILSKVTGQIDDTSSDGPWDLLTAMLMDEVEQIDQHFQHMKERQSSCSSRVLENTHALKRQLRRLQQKQLTVLDAQTLIKKIEKGKSLGFEERIQNVGNALMLLGQQLLAQIR
ncbi:hypothetical protein BDZ45DRAFT_694404 [Acephala macrosclerotiorum]|nr:hypothetical protein BDZ45DRAFT_694404 [Acephala macrosclerotiorum]